MKTLASATAIAALFTITATAQTNTAPAPAQLDTTKATDCTPQNTNNATNVEKCKTTGQVDPNSTDQINNSADTGKKGSADQATASTSPAGSVAGSVTEPGDINLASSFLASKVIGQKVYSGTIEKVGSIDDLIIDRQNGDILALIGVGGFLGIGSKDVAVRLDSLKTTKSDNSTYLTIDATREQLKAAPTFDSSKLTYNLVQ